MSDMILRVTTLCGLDRPYYGASVVDLRGRLSNPPVRDKIADTARLLDQRNRGTADVLSGVAPARRAVRPGRRSRQHRLSPDERWRLIADYRTGITAKVLAARYQVHRTTVTAILLRAGEPLRQVGLRDDQVEEAAWRYRDGWSLARLGELFGVDAETVRGALRRVRVRMRGPHERMQVNQSETRKDPPARP